MLDLLDKNRVPLKQYNLIVTGTNWTTYRAVGIPYQTVDGAWRLRANIAGVLSIASSGPTIAIQGVSLKALSSGFQAGATGTAGGTATGMYNLQLTSSSAQTAWAAAFDMELAGKPTFVQE